MNKEKKQFLVANTNENWRFIYFFNFWTLGNIEEVLVAAGVLAMMRWAQIAAAVAMMPWQAQIAAATMQQVAWFAARWYDEFYRQIARCRTVKIQRLG